MSTHRHVILVTAPRERPEFRLVIAFLWHDAKDVDTDGDSNNPASREWTELYIQNRADTDEVVDILPQEESPLVLRVESDRDYLAARVAYFLAVHMGGEVRVSAKGPYMNPDGLLPLLGDFDRDAAMRRVADSPFSRSSPEHPYPDLDNERDTRR